ncbi:MAG: hypothetical protein AB1Z22_00860 [Synechococcaceae cyanobacterium]
MSDRRQRLHELVLALLQQQEGLELLDGDGHALGGGLGGGGGGGDPASWLERNRRRLQRYQALVRTAVTLDALIDQEISAQL